MLPVEYHQASPHDISKRFKYTLIDYEGSPFWVWKTLGHDPSYEYARLDGYVVTDEYGSGSGTLQKLNANNPGFSVQGHGKQFGYMNVDDYEFVLFADRVPRRSMVQGFDGNTGLFGRYGKDETRYFRDMTSYPLNGKAYRTEPLYYTYQPSPDTQKRGQYWGDKLGLSYEWCQLIFNKGLVDMWKNNYPHAPEVLDVIDGERAIAVSRRHVIERDNFGDRFMACHGRRVAKFIGNRLRYAPGKEYLSGDIERTLGFQPV